MTRRAKKQTKQSIATGPEMEQMVELQKRMLELLVQIYICSREKKVRT